MNKADKKSKPQATVEEKLKDIREFLENQNALDIEAFQLENAFTDAMVVAGASSRRHAQGLADGVARLCAARGHEFLGMEGYENAQWILVDCNDMIVNILQQDARDLYKLEELWAHSARNK